MTSVRTVRTELGDARLYANRAKHPVATLVLGHGAGRGVDSPDLDALATVLPRRGVTVFRIEQPWVVAGKRVAPRPEVLDIGTIAGLNGIRVRTPLIVGGRSAGARSACRVARRMGAVGCVALSFPLHPPGRPDSSRLAELRGVGLPTLVVQGDRDAFGSPEEFPASTDLVAIPEADHGFVVPARAVRTRDETLDLVVEAVLGWVLARVS